VATIPDLRVWLILALVLGCVPAASAANVTIEQGDTFNLPNSNTSITWGYDQTFSIDQLAGYNDTLGIGDRNISIYEENGGSVNVTVFDYNLSRPVERGQDFLQFQVDADTGSDVVFRLTGFPDLDEGSYRVNGRDRVLAQRYDGGTLSWTDGDWSKKNITVRYDVGDDDSGSGGGSIDVDPFCRGDAVASELHSWYTNRSQFAMTEFEQGMELEEVTASTEANVSEFKLCAKRLDTVLVEEPDGAVYAYYNLTSTHTEAVTAATATFQVEESFLDIHDEVRVARYTGTEWTDLDTDRIEPGVYQVNLNRFSRFAVYGLNKTDTGTEPGDGTGEPDGNKTDGNESDGSMEPLCGDGQCTSNETWSTCPNDCPKPEPVSEAESALNAAQGNISQDDPGYSALQQAENAYENEEYDRAASLAEQALEQYRTAQRDDDGGLPLVPITAAVLLLVVALVGVWKRQAVIDRYHRFHRDRHQQEAEQRVDDIENRREEDDEYGSKDREVERRLNDVSTRVRDALETEEYSTKTERKLYGYLNQASEAVQDEEYLRAARVLDRVEELLEDKE
jgi:PGF-pre-PGF domain-containing protein